MGRGVERNEIVCKIRIEKKSFKNGRKESSNADGKAELVKAI